jgi:hypothetical protein
MSYRSNERFVPKQQRKQECPWYTVGGEMSDKNLEQWINKVLCEDWYSASETLALLTLTYGEHAMKKSSVSEWHRRFKGGRGDLQDDPRSGQPKMRRTSANAYRVQTLVRSDRRLGVRLIAEDPTSGLPDKWILHHDNAPAHEASRVLEFLAKKSITKMDHPLYSYDLAPCDFWLFPKLKIAPKGHRFAYIPDIQCDVTTLLRDIMENDFRQWHHRLTKCIASQGEYFEGNSSH